MRLKYSFLCLILYLFIIIFENVTVFTDFGDSALSGLGVELDNIEKQKVELLF